MEHATGGQQADTITGDSGANILDGQNSADTLNGGGGADTLIGGAGDDVFAYASAADLAAGEVISGGAGTGDSIRLFQNVIYNFALATISGVEQLRFIGTGGTRVAVWEPRSARARSPPSSGTAASTRSMSAALR